MTQVAALNSVQLPSDLGADNVQWIHIVPAGTNFGRNGLGPYKLLSANSVIENTRRYHGSTKMVVDFEHQSINAPKNGKPAPAAGWIVGLQSRADGIWGKVEWTAAAATAIRDKAYRYVSPVFIHSPDGEIRHIINVALTNVPNLDLVALATTELSFMDLEQQMIDLRKLLGLAADADFRAMRTTVEALQSTQAANSAVPDPARYVPIGEFTRVVQEANSLRQGISKHSAETYVDQTIREGKLMPYMKDWAIGLCSVNKPEFDRFITTTGPAFSHLLETVLPNGHRSQGAKNALDESEMAICTNLGLTTEQFIAARDNAGNAAE